MYSFNFILVYLATLFFISVILINYFRDFIITYRIFPKPKKRDLHLDSIPSSLGIIFPIAMWFGIFLINTVEPKSIENYNIIFISAFIISLIGFWDDLKSLKPRTKLLYQITLITSCLFFNDIVIRNLNGFLGIFEIPKIIGFPITIIIGLAIINSFNNIDGIDGLAALLSIVIFTCFGIMFWVLDYPLLFIICLSLTGVISAFLIFNFSESKKVFMGDSGSLFLGFIIFVMTLYFINNLDPVIDKLFHRSIIPIAPLVMFAYPIVDTISISFYRFSTGKNIFSPDNFHLHHMLLAVTKTHKISSLIVFVFMILIISIFSYLAFHMDHNFFIITFLVFFITLTISSIWVRNRMIKIGLLK